MFFTHFGPKIRKNYEFFKVKYILKKDPKQMEQDPYFQFRIRKTVFVCTHFIRQWLICRPLDFPLSQNRNRYGTGTGTTVPGTYLLHKIDTRLVATIALAVKRFNHLARSHPQTQLDLINLYRKPQS